MDWMHLASFVAACVLLTLTPGPDLIYVLTRSIAQGPRAGVIAAAGLATGILGHILASVIGLAAILAASPTAFTVIQVLGAGYLVYMGVMMWRSHDVLAAGGDNRRFGLSAIYRQSIVMALLNPKLIVFFLAFLPQFVRPTAGGVSLQLLGLGVIFMVTGFGIMATAGLAGGQVQRLIARRPDAMVWVTRAAGAVLILLGLTLLVAGQ